MNSMKMSCNRHKLLMMMALLLYFWHSGADPQALAQTCLLLPNLIWEVSFSSPETDNIGEAVGRKHLHSLCECKQVSCDTPLAKQAHQGWCRDWEQLSAGTSVGPLVCD